MSMGGLGGKPAMKTPGPINTPLTKSGTYTPSYPVQPMPDAVKNNINLGWNSQTGQVIQPLTAAQKAVSYTAPYKPNIQIPQQSVFPNVKTNSAGLFSPTQVTAPVKPMGLGQTAGPLNRTTSTSQANYNMGIRR